MSIQSRWATCCGVFGDLPRRCVVHGLRVVPSFLEPVLVAGWTSVVFLVARPQRRAVAENLQALFPAWTRYRATWGAWQVFWNFALTYVDAQRCETETGAVDWTVEGLVQLEDLAARQEGCIILTAHMGNYDLAAPVFSAWCARPLYTVRAPEREPVAQARHELEIRRKEALMPNFRTLYNREGNLLGVELARLLSTGAIVAVQGDRVIFEVSPMEVEVEPGLKMTLPKGPLYLARATSAPCFPLFIVRDGWRKYRVLALPELVLPPHRRGIQDPAAVLWAATILGVVRQHWQQWYVFEPLLKRTLPRPDIP